MFQGCTGLVCDTRSLLSLLQIAARLRLPPGLTSVHGAFPLLARRCRVRWDGWRWLSR